MASDRGSGVADRNPEVSGTDPPGCLARPLRPAAGRGRASREGPAALRRVLHPATGARNRSLRGRPVYRDRARNRNARTCDGRAGVLSLARLSRRRLRGPLAVGRKGGRVLRGQGLDLRLSGGCADGGDRSVPLRACSHRRRRVSEGPLERVSPLPETHAGRGLGQRGGVAELFRAPDRALFGLEESADGRRRPSCCRASASRGFVRRSKTATT